MSRPTLGVVADEVLESDPSLVECLINLRENLVDLIDQGDDPADALLVVMALRTWLDRDYPSLDNGQVERRSALLLAEASERAPDTPPPG